MVSIESEICGICDEVKELLRDPVEQFTSLDRLMSSADQKLTRIEVLRWGERPREGESLEEITLNLAVDVIRILQEFREYDPIDPNW